MWLKASFILSTSSSLDIILVIFTTAASIAVFGKFAFKHSKLIFDASIVYILPLNPFNFLLKLSISSFVFITIAPLSLSPLVTSTASLLLADAAFNTGKYIQGFPEYGPERMGAPITAYNRISDKPITIHSNIYEPDYVVVVDDTLLETVPVTSGLKNTGAIVINTTKNAEEIKGLLKGYEGKVYKIDARKISMETLGKYFPNTPMLAAIVKVSKIMTDEEFLNDMQGSFKHKFAKKPEVIEGNMKALEMALKEVEKV